MNPFILCLLITALGAHPAHAQLQTQSSDDQIVSSTVTDITPNYRPESSTLGDDQDKPKDGDKDKDQPKKDPPKTKDDPGQEPSEDPEPDDPSHLPDPGDWGDYCRIKIGNVDITSLITLGKNVWTFVVNNKPKADYKSLRGSIVPGGLDSWRQLSGWSKKKSVVKIYRVEFKNVFGKTAGGFDYRISYYYGGGLKGKGKYLGQIAFTPNNIKLHTDRQVKIRAELLDPINLGTEEDPIAGVSLIVTWSSPTTTRYGMSSAEYFIDGNGEIRDRTNGTF